MKNNNDNCNNTLKDPNIEPSIRIANQEPNFHPPHSVHQNAHQLPPPAQPPGLISQVPQFDRDVDTQHVGQEGQKQFGQQANNFPNVGPPPGLPNQPDFQGPSNNLSTLAKNEKLIKHASSKFITDIDQVEESSEEFIENLSKSLESNQRSFQDQNPPDAVTQKLRRNVPQNYPQQGQPPLFTKSKASAEDPDLQNILGDLSNSQSRLLDEVPSSLEKVNNPSHQHSLRHPTNNKAPSGTGLLHDVRRPDFPNTQQQAQAPSHFQDPLYYKPLPVQTPNNRAHPTNNPYWHVGHQQVSSNDSSSIISDHPIQDKSMTLTSNSQSFHRPLSSQNANQNSQWEPVGNGHYQSAHQIPPPIPQNVYQDPQAQNNPYYDFYLPHHGYQNQPPVHPGQPYPAYPYIPNPNYLPQYPYWPHPAPGYIPGPFPQNPPTSYPPPQMTNYRQDNNYPHHQTPINNNLQNHNFHNHLNYPLPGYQNPYPQDPQPSSQTSLDNQKDFDSRNNISTSFPRQQEDRARHHHQRPEQSTQAQQQCDPQNPAPRATHDQSFTQEQRNNESIHSRSQNSQNKSFTPKAQTQRQGGPQDPPQKVAHDSSFTQDGRNSESIHPRCQNYKNQSSDQPSIRLANLATDNSANKKNADRPRQKSPTPPQNRFSTNIEETGLSSKNEFNRPKTLNESTRQLAQPTQSQIKKVARPPFSKLEFDPNSIIHFIQYGEASENGALVEKYLLSDAELVRFGGLISANNRQSLIRSDEVDGAVIEFKKLASINAKFIGAFGRPKAMFQALADNSFIAHNEISCFEKYFAKSGAGLYLLPMRDEEEELLILLILYSNEDKDFDKVDEKRSYIRLLRYLTQLCPLNLFAVDEKDVSLISPEENNEVQDFLVTKPQANKLTEDACKIIEGNIIESIAGSKKLIASLSFSGFHTKSFFASQTEIIESVHEWKSKYNYDKSFADCQVSVDKLEDIPVETMHIFLQDHFYSKFQSTVTNFPYEVKRLEGLRKNLIDNEVKKKLKSLQAFYAVKCMIYRKLPERDWLEQALKEKKITDPQEFADISEAYDKIIKLTAADKEIFTSIQTDVSKRCLFETEIICIRRILEEFKIYDFDRNRSILKEFEATSTSLEAAWRLKDDICKDVVAQINATKSLFSNWFQDWKVDTLLKSINNEKWNASFFRSNSKACIRDALRLFRLLCEQVAKRFDFQAIEEETRNEHRGQLEPVAKKSLLFQAIKDCLERKEGKGSVTITDLKRLGSINYELKYEMKVVTEAYHEHSVCQYELRKSELEDAKNTPGLIFCPTSKPVTTFQIPESAELVNVIFMKGSKLAVVVNSQGRSEIRFYNTARPNDASFSVPFGQTISKMDYNEKKKKIAFYTKKDYEATAYIYGISDDFRMKNEATIDLTARFAITDVHCLCLGNNNELFIADSQGNLRSIDYRNETARKLNVSLKGLKLMFLVPEEDCLLLITSAAVIPYIIKTDKVLPEIPLSPGIRLDNLVITKFDSQRQLLFEENGKICSKLIDCTLSTENYKLVDCTPKEFQAKPESLRKRSIFDYFGYIYAKFSVYNPMEALHGQSMKQKLVVYCSSWQTHNKESEAKIQDKLREIQDNIKKPHSDKLGLADNAVFTLAGEDHSQLLYAQANIKSLDRWMQELISLVPIQIGRTENNQYMILKEGKALQLSDAKNLYKVKEKISYGFIEAILNNWSKPVKVISSMGKQSTGKSYTLNHLSGGTFAIAGGRCTDGCWLSLKITDDCLYVLMDFEGLGSFERSEQEDMLLSITNAALSNITLYKIGFSYDKETDKMFYRFNQGANLLKGDDKIFKGLFCLLIKDVDDKDTKEVMEEFRGSMNKIIEKSEKKDFLTTMYKGGFLIQTFDFFKNDKYYKQTEKLAKFIRCDVESSFTNGKDFLNLLKTIQAKLAIQDFTSLSRQDIDARIYILNEHYLNALMFGSLEDKKGNRKMYILRSYDDAENVIEEEIEVEVKEPNAKARRVSYSDPDINLMLESTRFIDVFNEGFAKTEDNHAVWSSLFRDFVKTAVKRRTARVLRWIDMNLQKWAQVEEFQELVATFKQLVGHKAKETEMRFQICLSNCSQCFAACTLLNAHIGDHSCQLADHKCRSACTYCKEKNRSERCSLNFGHDERHACSSYNHTCGTKCEYPKCEGKCVQATNHNNSHKCGLAQHICPEKCSLDTCTNQCQISADKTHTIHKCVNDQCSKMCEVKGCQNRCQCTDHFHGNDRLSKQFKTENGIDASRPNFITSAGIVSEIDFHCCGIVHPCAEDCSESGFCKVIVERKVVKEEFKGKKGQFSYQKQFENIGNKTKCCKVIPEYQKTHDGDHVHSLDPATVHICETRCPTCNNICEKQAGHPGKHNTAHGNMEKCYFVSNQTDIDIGDHQYVVGESAVAEMCHMFCKSLGRGHIHLVECGHKKDTCPNRDEGKRRHETCQYGPDVNVSKDEVLHEVYWDLINFEDPCQRVDIDEYSKCPFYCASFDHANDQDKKYCELKLWHNKVNNLAETGKNQGSVSKDGHFYQCTHNLTVKGFHFVFCLDKSGSMEEKPWNDLTTAVRDFCASRGASPADRLSIVTFDDTQQLTCENIPFAQFNAGKHLIFRGGDTRFAPAIALCHQVFKRTYDKDMIPIFVFMSDGDDKTGDAEITSLNAEFGPKGLRIFAIAFGTVEPKLKQLADLVKGTYTNSANGLALREAFMQISSKFPTVISVALSKK